MHGKTSIEKSGEITLVGWK